MATDSGYERGNYLRVCDICGHRYHFRDLTPIGELRFACPDDAPGLTAVQISRFNARARPLVVRPNKWAKDYTQTPIYQLAEAQIFNFIASTAPADAPDGTSGVAPAAWAGIYMADVILDARRPLIWDRRARTVLKRCCDFLLTKQYTADSLLLKYGGINDTGSGASAAWFASNTIAAGVAFAKAYQALGVTSYLAAAERCAIFLRRAQRADLHSTTYTVFPNGSASRFRIKGIAQNYFEAPSDRYDDYLVDDLLAMWLFKLLGDIRGVSTIYGGSPTAFISSCDASVATILSELQEFADVGVMDSAVNVAVTPISTTAPKSRYSAAHNGSGGSCSWASLSVGSNMAFGLRGLYEAAGATAQVTAMVSACFLAVQANPANATPAGTTDVAFYAGITGDFDAQICPTTAAGYTSSPFIDLGSIYDWTSLGILAPIMDAGTLGNLRTSKDTLSTAQKFAVDRIDLAYMGRLGQSGLGFQTSSFTASVTAAAKTGGVYRVNPGRYPALRGN